MAVNDPNGALPRAGLTRNKCLTRTGWPQPEDITPRERLFRPLADQPPLELPERRQHVRHRLTGGRRGVDGAVEGDQRPALLLRRRHKRRESIIEREGRSGFATTSAVASPALTLDDRSEEHTSELQSLRHLVCRLLLEKKKNTPEIADRQIGILV